MKKRKLVKTICCICLTLDVAAGFYILILGATAPTVESSDKFLLFGFIWAMFNIFPIQPLLWGALKDAESVRQIE